MKKIYMIGNSHLDPVWLWQWQEGYAEVISTFRSALDRISEFDNFVFSCAGAVYYMWIERTNPQMFEEIQKRVKEGRWVIVGGWWIQPDCNAPSGESFARHTLYSQRYFKEKFGVIAKVGYNVDSFGHNAMLPQILKNSGMNGYVFMRPNAEEMQYPFEDNVFLWESPDGTKIPAFRIVDAYNSAPFDDVSEKAKETQEVADKQNLSLMFFYGVGNHGGGPTIKSLNELEKLISESDKESFVFSSPNEYFDELDKSGLKTIADELQNHALGCLTAVMKIKSENRLSESKLYSAEVFNTIAVSLGLLKPESVKPAWEKVMFNQFHDIMGGCCLKSAAEDALRNFGYAQTVADEIENRALQSITWNIDTSKGFPVLNQKFESWENEALGIPLVVFNPLPFDTVQPLNLGYLYSSVEDENGDVVPSQKLRSKITNLDVGRYETRIVAKVPAYGWRVYWLHNKISKDSQIKGMLNISENVLENDWYLIKFSGNEVVSIYDKVKKVDLISDKLKAVVLDEFEYDTWAHRVTRFDKNIGYFKMNSTDVIENGDICGIVRLKGEYGNSQIEIQFALYREIPEIYVTYNVNWQEKHKMLKLHFPTNHKNGKSISGIPYGFLERDAHGMERPMQNFVCAVEGNNGICISTDSRAAYDFKDGILAVTALRSPAYADHFGVKDDRMDFTDQGEQSFKINISAYNGSLSKVQQSSFALRAPLKKNYSTYHTGHLPEVGSAVFCDKDNIEISAFKIAEDKNGYILRCYETTGKEVDAQIKLLLLEKTVSAHFNAQEIKTFKITEKGIFETDFTEDLEVC